MSSYLPNTELTSLGNWVSFGSSHRAPAFNTGHGTDKKKSSHRFMLRNTGFCSSLFAQERPYFWRLCEITPLRASKMLVVSTLKSDVISKIIASPPLNRRFELVVPETRPHSIIDDDLSTWLREDIPNLCLAEHVQLSE